jgi:hypothetical protein
VCVCVCVCVRACVFACLLRSLFLSAQEIESLSLGGVCILAVIKCAYMNCIKSVLTHPKGPLTSLMTHASKMEWAYNSYTN